MGSSICWGCGIGIWISAAENHREPVAAPASRGFNSASGSNERGNDRIKVGGFFGTNKVNDCDAIFFGGSAEEFSNALTISSLVVDNVDRLGAEG